MIVNNTEKYHCDGGGEYTTDTQKHSTWQLTYSNIVLQAVLHSKRTKLEFENLKCAVEDMIDKTNWRPSPKMLCNGVPSFYEHDYAYRMGYTDEVDMSWWDS